MNDELIVSLKKPKLEEPTPDAAESSPPVSYERRRETRRTRSRFPYMALIILIVLGAAVYFVFFRTTEPNAGLPEIETGTQTQESAAAAEEVRDVIEKVSELIMLPEGEEPTVATVSDPEKLRGQTFFENAKVGHKVLIYTKARKAYLYDPKAHRLIEVAPITTEVQ